MYVKCLCLARYWYQSIHELERKNRKNCLQSGKVRSCKRFIGRMFNHSSKCENAQATLRSACARFNQQCVKHGLGLSEMPSIVDISEVSLSAHEPPGEMKTTWQRTDGIWLQQHLIHSPQELQSCNLGKESHADDESCLQVTQMLGRSPMHLLAHKHGCLN